MKNWIFQITLLIINATILNSQPYDNIYIPTANYKVDMLQTPFVFQKVHDQRIAFGTLYGRYTVISENNNLLFACNGENVLNRNFEIMKNGDELKGFYSEQHCSMAIRQIQDINKYYLFAGRGHRNGSLDNGKLYYSEIDLSAENGQGAVIEDSKNTLLAENLLSTRTYIPTCDGYWFITKENSSRFKVYKIDKNGLDTSAIISDVGEDVHYGKVGLLYDKPPTIDVSYDGKLIALSYNEKRNFVEIFRFDTSTGKLSKHLQLPLDHATERACDLVFSRNEQVLYYHTYYEDSFKLFKVAFSEDLSSYSQKIIFTYKNSKPYLVDEFSLIHTDYNDDLIFSPYSGIMRLSKDGSRLDTVSSFEISNTSLLLSNQFCPPHKVVYYPELIHKTSGDTIVKCPSEVVKLYPIDKLENVTWNETLRKDTIEAIHEGMYVMTGSDNICTYYDTIYVKNEAINTDDDLSYNLCGEDDLRIELPPIYTDVIWQTTNDSVLIVSESGTYFFESTVGSCLVKDSIQVTKNPAINAINDTMICDRYPIIISLDDRLQMVQWSDGDLSRNRLLAPGSHDYMAEIGSCIFADTFQIIGIESPEVIGNLEKCMGESIEMSLPLAYENVVWSDGYKAMENHKREFFNEGIYAFTALFQICAIKDTIEVTNKILPSNTLADTTICQDANLEIRLAEEYENVEWSDAYLGNDRTISTQGIYSFEAIVLGCKVEEQFEVTQYERTKSPFSEDSIKLCKGETLPDIENLLWNTTPPIIIESGWYGYEYIDTFLCVNSGEAYVTAEACNQCTPTFANVLSLSQNTKLPIFNACSLRLGTFTLYDRWGNQHCQVKITSSDELELCDNVDGLTEGVYVYQLIGENIDGTTIRFLGDITILK